jgi:hypothetical protein
MTVDSYNVLIELAKDKTYTIDQYAPGSFTINSIAVKTSTGTCTVDVLREGVGVSGIYGVSASTSEATANATGNNSVSAGETVAFVIRSNSAAENVAATIKITRA